MNRHEPAPQADTAGVLASGQRAIAVSGDVRAPVTTGDNSPVTVLGSLPPIGEVPPTVAPVGMPGIGVFVGRSVELGLLATVASSAAAVVVQVVSGLGGVGKSSLVARYAMGRAAGDFTQVVWVSADSPAALDAGLAEFAVALEPAAASALPVKGLVERAVGWLGSHAGWLLVLDNVTDPGLVRALLPRMGRGLVVVTSRRSTGWAGIAEPLVLDVLDLDAAGELMRLTVGQERGVLLGGVEVLCERLGCLPLALDQAASFMAQNMVTVERYVELLDSQPSDMLGDAAEGTPPERTLAHVWDVSLDALVREPLAARVLRVLAWMSPDGVPRSLLSGLGGEREVVRAVGRLAAYSMLVQDHQGVITVHRLVQALARTSQPGHRHRDSALVERARRDATRLLIEAAPDDVDDPACWPTWRMLAEHVVALARHAPEQTDTHDTTFLLDCVGQFFEGQGSLPTAITFLKRAAAGCERLEGPESFNAFAARANLASAHQASGEFKQAAALNERNLAVRERLLGPSHPDTLMSRHNLANAYHALGEYARALELHQQVLAERERSYGPDHPETVTSRNSLACDYHAVGDHGRAVALFEQVVAQRDFLLGPAHPETLSSRHNLAVTYRALAQYVQAVALLERVVAEREQILGPTHPATLNSRHNLAVVYAESGDRTRALEVAERALVEREKLLGPDHPDTQQSHHNLMEIRSRGMLDV